MNDGSRPLLAAAWMTGAIVSFSSMAVAGRAVSHELDTFELMMYRSVIGLALVIVFGLATGKIGEVRRDRLGLHFIRNICHFAGQNLWFYALTLVTLSQVFALEFTSPIWVMVLAVMLLGERLSQARFLAVALGFTGALIVARPVAWAYGLVGLAALIRVAGAEAAPGCYDWAMLISGALWLLAYVLFVGVYWPILTRPRQNAAT